MKRGFITLAVLVGFSLALISCGNSNPTSPQPTTSGLKFRAFVSNPLEPISGGGGRPVINIVDAMKDVLSPFSISLATTVPDPGLMAVSPTKKYTVVFSSSSNSLAVIDNIKEHVAQNSSGQSVPAINLPGSSESMVMGVDDQTVYAAVPNAPVVGQTPGALLVVNFIGGRIAATLPVPAAHWVVRSHNGNRLLVFGDNSNTVAVIAPSLIGTSTDPRTFVCCFDHPVWGVVSSDDTTAYIFNCGPECGGTTAGITVLDLNTDTAGTFLPLSAATIGFLNGTTLYVAGTPPATPCGSGTAATTCGTLNVVDTGTLTATNATPILISDGYHDRIDLGSNGLLFIGARNCTNITASSSGGEVRGCLSLFNTNTSTASVAPDNGDVTGIQPISFRNVVYVVENGELRIYDTTTGTLQSTQVDIIGQAIDVKLVD